MVNAQVYDNKTTLSGIRDKRLISILQTDASKDIDENVEPREVYQGKLPDMIESNQAVNRQGFIPTVDKSGPSYTLSDAKIPIFLPLQILQKTPLERTFRLPSQAVSLGPIPLVILLPPMIWQKPS